MPSRDASRSPIRDRSLSHERGRTRTRSRSYSRPRSGPAERPSLSASRERSPQRSITPRSADRSRSRSPRNGRRSFTPDRRSRSRSPRRSQSYSRSPSPDSFPPRTTKIIVENLTKNVKVAHLEEIFGRYGPVKDVSMPLNQTYGTSRGTAYIMFEEPEHADNALVHMHEGQLDGAVLSVSVVAPKRRFSRSPPPLRPRGPPRGGRDDFGGRGGPPGAYRPPPMSGPPRAYRDRSPMRRRSRSPPGGYRGRGGGRGGFRGGRGGYGDSYDARRLASRSRSPRRSRSRSYSRSISRSPPRRGRGGGGGGGRRYSPPRRSGGGGGGRRSPSYTSYDSYSDRSRSRSRGGRDRR